MVSSNQSENLLNFRIDIALWQTQYSISRIVLALRWARCKKELSTKHHKGALSKLYNISFIRTRMALKAIAF
jgi:hypothetical protein